MALLSLHEFKHEEEEIDSGGPRRYVPLLHVYSATDPCVITPSGSSNVMSKKVKARKFHPSAASEFFDSDHSEKKPPPPPPPLRVYYRRTKRPRHCPANKPSLFDSLESGLKLDADGIEGGEDRFVSDDDQPVLALDSVRVARAFKKRKNAEKQELVNLGVINSSPNLAGPQLRESRVREKSSSARMRKCNSSDEQRKPDGHKHSSGSDLAKKWVELDLEHFDPQAVIGLKCKVYWPRDDEWYAGSVAGYNSETKQHHIEYKDDENESLVLVDEKMKFYISREEMLHLKLQCSSPNKVKKGLNYDEMLVLAADIDYCQDLELGDIIWAKLTGHAMWPAIVVNDSHIDAKRCLKPRLGERVPVQFFGTHDFARINVKQVISFLRGLLSCYHLKCRHTRFKQSLEEATMYLREGKLPYRMQKRQKGNKADDDESASGEDEGMPDSSEDYTGDERTQKCMTSCPFEIEDLRVVNLGKIVTDSEFFHNTRHTWPEGYTAVRKYISTIDPSIITSYKMEVLRDPESKAWPLFRVTSDNGEQIDGSSPSVCWKKIYRKIDKIQNNLSNGCKAENGGSRLQKPGSYMFGFSIRKISKLIQDLRNSDLWSKPFSRKIASNCHRDQPNGYRPVRVDWKDLDKCSVCHMDEEYENNLFLQCDKCLMMVHARCYGQSEPLDGVLWLCNLCRPKAPTPRPPCCLCPVIGGAMKPTTDGRWAHLTCAMWIPETCLKDIKKMEPIDGLDRINKCSNSTCRVAYHPLCARAADLCVELEDEDRIHLMSVDEDDDQCIRLLSFCKRHRQPSHERSPSNEQIGQTVRNCSSYTPPSNLSGCARTEPYDFFGRRGRKEPEALAAASVKRLFVENRPYLVSGYRQNGSLGNVPSCNELVLSSIPSSIQKLKMPRSDTPKSILCMAEKYTYMRETFRKRLAFGKSGIHGFGIFAKLAHSAGDMVIEYTGELVRPPIADIREHFIYNSLVGAGTYMFRIDDERVIDATRAGSIAHLINHSCEPNCYSRVISVHGDEHIIIFAKRDIKQWEELTYDYRFFSIDEQLACYCGFPRCRGVVNDIEAEEQVAKICVPRSELIDWRGK
ncbi:histone-lysine N-methyltransferase TRX1-like isoform X2 [Magnolia sinica]|uniref:histone-lysine N-methyltransferase TRX1-like isoform X2 n=1 Tax=Magnolia sinica TaxID=86752 RepID=UPI002657CFEA|nr:histone-lysine N-methyltransferase TRX1-like isoform X2 [Magnolia sinica]